MTRNNNLVDMTDESKKTCEYCHYWDRSEINYDDPAFFRYKCRNVHNVRANKMWKVYFQKCKRFKWREDIIKADKKNNKEGEAE